MTGRRRLLGEYIWSASGSSLSAILQFLLYVLLARNVEPHEFGIAMSMLGMCLALQAFFEFGLGRLVLRERARDHDSELAIHAVGVAMIAFTIFAVAIACAIFISATLWDPTVLWLLPLCLAVPAEAWATLRYGVALADQRASVMAVDLIARRTLALALFYAGMHTDINSLGVFSLALTGTGLLAIAFVNIRVPIRRPTTVAPKLKPVLRQSLPFWINSASVQSRNVDVLVVGLVGNAATAGYFSAARRIVGPLTTLTNALNAVLLPATAKVGNNGTERISRGIWIVSLSSILPYTGLVAAAPTVVPLALGDAYIGTIPAFQWIVAGLPLAVHASLFTAYLQGQGLAKQVAQISLICTTAYFLLLVTLVPIRGAVGAAAAFICCSFLQVCLQALVTRQLRNASHSH